MPDRRAQILLLYASRFDGLPGPKPNLTTPSGLAPGSREACGSCDGLGKVRDRYSRSVECARCQGRGRLTFDRMDSLHVPVGSNDTIATARPRATKKCDSCDGAGAHGNGRRCDVCDGLGKRDLHVFELHITDEAEPEDIFDRWNAAMARREASGSYADLDRAVAGIARHVNKPPQFRFLTANAKAATDLLDDLYVVPTTREESDLTPAERALLEAALGYIDSRMPTPIRVGRDVVDNAKIIAERRTRARGRGSHPNALAQRSREMRAHAKQGRSPQWIAAEYGVSVSTVYEVVNARRSA